MQLGQAEWQWERWCPGRESYATTDTTDRCLSLVWWRECLARWRRFADPEPHYRGSPVLLLAVQPSSLGSCFMACGGRRVFDLRNHLNCYFRRSLSVALRRQRSHVRIVSGAPDFPYLPARYARADLNSGSAPVRSQ